MNREALRDLLEKKYHQYSSPEFIARDPISIPHRFTRRQDVEISGFFAATLAWGNRTSIINSASRLMQRMDDAPYDFIMQHHIIDLKRFLDFKHRTFQAIDLLYFIHFLKWFYSANDSLEKAFSVHLNSGDLTTESALVGFHHLFTSLEVFPARTGKHVSTPARNSACKRLNMYLRWMVRSPARSVDFGIWKQIKPSQLVCPCDVHVLRVARNLGLVPAGPNNWKTALALTQKLRELDPQDPVKYDLALFGLGVMERY